MTNSCAQSNKYVLVWLVFCLLAVLSMVFIGGYTRLTGSGLSIVEWKPVVGTIPPLSDNDWDIEFNKYKLSPEYVKINNNFSLNQFKQIFYVEYFHRLMGRLTAFIFFLPLIYFYFKGALNNKASKNILVIAALGAFQGFSGWYMVKSGLINDPHVSHFRLAVHLVNALLIFSLILWNIFSLSSIQRINNYSKKLYYMAWVVLALLFIQIAIGALVAGLKGGLIYNSFPLMNGNLLPDEIHKFGWFHLSNAAIIQFYHRLFAFISLLAIVLVIVLCNYLKVNNFVRQRALSTFLVFLLQGILGVLTLVNMVPIAYALAHQITAFLVFFAALLFLYSFDCTMLKARD
jgi:cytochrome c oxidase assembly protein subunit 15